MYGIAGYEPTAVDSVDEVVRVHGPRLRTLVGRTLRQATGLCFDIDGEWCSTQPLVLDFGGPRMEIVFDGLDQMLIGWNSIDLAVPLDTPDQDDPDLALSWADPRRPELDAMLGAVVERVRVMECLFRFERADGVVLEPWMLSGLELVFEGGRVLPLFNVVSETKLAAEPPGADWWRRRELN